MTYQAKVIDGGKIVIPAELRREMGIEVGDSLLIERLSDGALSMKTYAQVVRDVQDEIAALRTDGAATSSVVDELIAERRHNAAAEEAGHQDWIRDPR